MVLVSGSSVMFFASLLLGFFVMRCPEVFCHVNNGRDKQDSEESKIVTSNVA